MNQELTQRIIGAIVVTALAAIFIPMLFEDPVDNSGQVVSELVIPEEPAFTVDDSASKLPRNAEEIEALPDETVETPEKSNGTAFTDMENPPPPPSEDDEAEGMDPDAPADEGSPPDADTGSAPPSSPPAASFVLRQKNHAQLTSSAAQDRLVRRTVSLSPPSDKQKQRAEYAPEHAAPHHQPTEMLLNDGFHHLFNHLRR
jgi:DedD protein